MELEEIRECMEKRLKKSRCIHTFGTEEVAFDLALIYGYDTKKASIAGLLHDCAKNLTDEELLIECEKYHLPISEIEMKSTYLLHAKVGAVYAKLICGVEDEDILNAITYHTTGRPSMSLLEKIIFCADYIEPNRKLFPGMDEIRRVAYENIDYTVYLILINTLEDLKNKGAIIDTLTTETYEYYKSMFQVPQVARESL